MAVYLINIILILGFGFIFIHTNPSDNKKKIYCTICSILWILISGLRDNSVGDDTWSYYYAFERVKQTSWKTVFSDCWNYLFHGLEIKDPGYTLIQKIFQIFFDDYRWWLFFIAILFTGLMARWIYKYSVMPDISFLIFSVLFFSFYAVTGHRQTIATALIVFLGYELAKKREFVKFAIVAFIAFMIHKSSIVFIIYYFVASIKITPIYVLCMIAASALIVAMGKELYGPVADLLGFQDELIDYTGGGAETFATVLVLLCIVTFSFYPWINKRRRDSKYLYNMLFLTLVTTLLVYQNQSFMRIQQYFSLVIMIFVPELIQAFDKNYRVIPYLFVVGFLCAYFLRLDVYYKFFFI